MRLEEHIDDIYDEMVTIRRDFHQHPELGDEEHRTHRKICLYLTAWGIQHTTIADTGVLGIIQGAKPGKTVGIRGDIDALPLVEANEASYKSLTHGKMHACGHDAHTTILLATAKILNESRDTWSGQVKLFFQPAEETDGGALRMIQEGCMENPKVDYVLGLHVMPHHECGIIELKYDQMNAASDRIFIQIKGKSGHGAYPHTAVDAIVVSGQVLSALQTVVSRSTAPTNGLVVTVGTIHGGSKYNNIADEVSMEGTLRSLDEGTRAMAKDKIKKIVTSVAESFGATAEVWFEEGYAVLVNDNRVVEMIRGIAESTLGKERVVMKAEPSMGVDDFSYFLREAPGSYYHLGCGNEAKGISAALHNCSFDLDEEAMKTGVLIHLKNTLALLNGALDHA